jgi:hypothetical protein
VKPDACDGLHWRQCAAFSSSPGGRYEILLGLVGPPARPLFTATEIHETCLISKLPMSKVPSRKRSPAITSQVTKAQVSPSLRKSHTQTRCTGPATRFR